MKCSAFRRTTPLDMDKHQASVDDWITFVTKQEMIPDITVAEQRMAAFTRLHLNTKQMASMLGISPDSFYKIRQRLRKRLQLDDEVATEAYLTKI